MFEYKQSYLYKEDLETSWSDDNQTKKKSDKLSSQ